MVDNVTRISADFLTSLPGQSSDVYGVLLARAAIYCVVWPVIIIVGVFGNVLSMIVIWRTKDFTTTAKFLTSLAVADTLTLIVKGVQVVFTLGDIFWPIQYLTWKLSINSIFNLSLLPDRISKGITVAMVCDRVVGITVPLRYKLICLPRRISTIITMVYVVIAVTSLPHIVDFFAYHFISVENRTIHTDMGEEYVTNVVSHSTVKRLHFIINILVFDCMPIIVVFLCNIIIIISLRNRDVLASTTNEVQLQRKLQEKQITKLLLTISVLFLVLASPTFIYVTFMYFLGVSPPDVTTAKLVSDILMTLSLTNCSINFIVYAVMNRKYREGYVAILCRCRQHNDIQDPRRY